jgi:hypothetical protein
MFQRQVHVQPARNAEEATRRNELPSVSSAPFVITIEPVGPVTSSPFPALEQALERARELEAAGHIITSISNGEVTLRDAELRKALGETPQHPGLFV